LFNFLFGLYNQGILPTSMQRYGYNSFLASSEWLTRLL